MKQNSSFGNLYCIYIHECPARVTIIFTTFIALAKLVRGMISHWLNFLTILTLIGRHCVSGDQRYTEVSVAQGTVRRETLAQYITFKREGRGESVLLYSAVLQL
jgi:hypothetical protein